MKKRNKVTGNCLFGLLLITAISSCSVNKQISKQANAILFKDTAISTGHIGISIYEPATGKYWYNYNASHYFIPASNTKLFTLYAGMKYLGDSLVGLTYQNFSDTSINVIGTGDPTFLHSDFKNQPILDFFKTQNKTIYLSDNFKDDALGYGWSWDDYNSSDMAERNAFPVYGNCIKISTAGYKHIEKDYSVPDWKITPSYFEKFIPNEFVLSPKYVLQKKDSNELKKMTENFLVERDRGSNNLNLIQGGSHFNKTEIPFVTEGVNTALGVLKDEYHFRIVKGILSDNSLYPVIPEHLKIHKIKTQPSDSLFKPMMHRSDNFFAEQTLLMASNEHLAYMKDEAIIDTILKSELKDIPQRPKWVDGSGLSRYNLFTPQSFVYLLDKMKKEFGLERLKVILPTGNEGTLKKYYVKDAGSIYAKTGTLSNNCALSGFLVTNKGKLLIFSILVNNYITGATPVRRAVERFLENIRKKN